MHKDAPVTFQTRWTLSYLAGPLTRLQIRTLMDRKRPAGSPAKAAPPAAAAAAADLSRQAQVPMGSNAAKPLPEGPLPGAVAADASASAGGPAAIPAEVPQYYLPLRGETPKGAELVYQPGVLAAATVSFLNEKSGVSTATRSPPCCSGPRWRPGNRLGESHRP